MHTTDELAAAQAAVDANPSDAASHARLGIALFYQERYQEARAAFEQALALDPTLPDAHNGIGRVNYHIGTPEAAIAAYNRAIELDPRYVPGYWGLGFIYLAKLGRYDDAAASFRLGLERIPEEHGFHVGLGHAYARHGRFPQAIAAYETAARLMPDDPEGDDNLAIIYLYQRRYREALAASQRAIARAPEQAQRRVLGFIHHLLGEHEQAVAALEYEIARVPDDYEARAGLARAYRAVGREAEAAEQEAAARALAADDDEGGRACLESVLGNADAAVELLERALSQRLLTAGWARIDPEFAFLQDDPRYQALLQRY